MNATITLALLMLLFASWVVFSSSRLFEEMADSRAARLVREDGLNCDSHYLQLDFICDPNHLLSHTEAVLLNETTSKNFTHCFVRDFHRSKRHVFSKYTIGLALARTIHGADLRSCSGKSKLKIRLVDKMYDQNPETGKLVYLTLKQFALQLRYQWTLQPSVCETDILVLAVRGVILCLKKRLIVADSGQRMLLAVSFSDRVQKIISEQYAMSIFRQTLSSANARMPLTMVSTENIVSMFRTLDSALRNVSMFRKQPSQLPMQNIPLWALILFAISFVLTVVCATVGHCVAYGKRARFNNQYTSAFAKTTSNERWRAGFGGGLMKIRSNVPNVNQTPHPNDRNFVPRPRLAGGLIVARRKELVYQNSYRVV